MENQKYTFQRFRNTWYLIPLEELIEFRERRKEIEINFPNIETEKTGQMISKYGKYKIDFVEDFIFENPINWKEIGS